MDEYDQRMERVLSPKTAALHDLMQSLSEIHSCLLIHICPSQNRPNNIFWLLRKQTTQRDIYVKCEETGCGMCCFGYLCERDLDMMEVRFAWTEQKTVNITTKALEEAVSTLLAAFPDGPGAAGWMRKDKVSQFHEWYRL